VLLGGVFRSAREIALDQSKWSEACRDLRRKVELEFEGYTHQIDSPETLKQHVLEIEYRRRQALMERDNAERALIFGPEATPVFSIVGVLICVAGGLALVISIYDWLGGGVRGGTWTIGLFVLTGWLLEYGGSKLPKPSFWNYVIIATAGILVLLGIVGIESLVIALVDKIQT
jgi:hypothetical protein